MDSEQATEVGCLLEPLLQESPIIGTALANREKGRHIITSRIEHPAVIEACKYLEERLGFTVTYLPVEGYGLVDPGQVEDTVRDHTTLIRVMYVNNEVGTTEPIKEIGSQSKSESHHLLWAVTDVRASRPGGRRGPLP